MINLKRGKRRVWSPPWGCEMVVVPGLEDPDDNFPELSDERRKVVVRIMRELALASSEMDREGLTDDQKEEIIRIRARKIRELVSESHEITL